MVRIRIFVIIGRPTVHTGGVCRSHLCWDLIGWQSSTEIDVIRTFVLVGIELLMTVHLTGVGILVVPRKTGLLLLIRPISGS